MTAQELLGILQALPPDENPQVFFKLVSGGGDEQTSYRIDEASFDENNGEFTVRRVVG